MTELLLLRVVHILAGTCWLGTVLVNTLFLMPAVGGLGPSGGQVMKALTERGILRWLFGSSVLTLLSGMRLLSILAANAPGVFFQSRMGHMFMAAGSAALLAFLVAMMVIRPSHARAAVLLGRAGDASEADRRALQEQAARLRARAGMASAANVALLVASVMGMAVARYL